MNITAELSIPAQANRRFQDLTRKESEKGGRIIGGDLGDLRFQGYTVEDDRTVLNSPELLTSIVMDENEAANVAQSILDASFQSIGVETVEHS